MAQMIVAEKVSYKIVIDLVSKVGCSVHTYILNCERHVFLGTLVIRTEVFEGQQGLQRGLINLIG
jgi:hypothetical protein